MNEILPFIVIGLVTGSVYGLAGTGLVLTYKTSGIFNLGYGANAALTVFVFYFLHTEQGMAWPLAAILCLLVLAPLEGLAMELVARILEPFGATEKVIATIGLIVLIVSIGTIWYGSIAVDFPAFLPSSSVHFAGVNVEWSQIIVVVVSLAAGGTLYYFFRFVRLGVAMRGVVDNPDLLAMTGEDPIRVRRWAWVIGSVFASLAGLLLAPNLSLDALVITLLVVQAFGAAAIGYFKSLPMTLLGGLVIGVIGALSAKFVTSVTWLAGLPAGLPFIILFVVLVVTPKAKLIERRVTPSRAVRKSWYAPVRVRMGIFALVVAALLFVPQLTGADVSIWSSSLVDVILFLSLGLLVRKSGQLSLCTMAFAAIGAAAFSHFADSYHIPWLLALALSALVVAPVGALIAIPAVRLTGVFLAVATFGFGILVAQMFYTTSMMFGPTTSGIAAPRPDISIGPWHLYTTTGYYYVLLAAAVLTVGTMMAIQRGRMGRLLSALADSPAGLETQGTTTTVVRVTIFCISAAVAGIAGALLAGIYHFSVGSNYTWYPSLVLAVLVVIIVMGDPWWAVVAALAYNVFPDYVTVSHLGSYLGVLFGLSAILYPITVDKAASVPLWWRRALERLGGRPSDHAVRVTTAPVAVGADVATSPAQQNDARVVRTSGQDPGHDRLAAGERHRVGSGLEVKGVSVRFGGVVALDNVSLVAPIGRITGLVGPNGAGKTTLFNVSTGLVRPERGQIIWNGRDITSLGQARRARLGLGRTFQRAEVFGSLTVEENVALGREARLAGGSALTQLVTRRRDQSVVRSATQEAAALTGIEPLLGRQAGLLPIGQRRLVELARALAGTFDLLMLDEPSSGLDDTETAFFGEILTSVVGSRGLGVLLVEHDMELVCRICDHVYVLDFGKLVFSGTPEEMVASPVVRSAYLGLAEPAVRGPDADLDVSTGTVIA